MSDGISIKGIVAPNGTVHHYDHEYLDNNPIIPNAKDATSNLIVYKYQDTTTPQGVTLHVNNRQEVVLTGTPSANGVVVLSNDITLPAGTYYYGALSGLAEGVTSLQIRKIVNGADAGAAGNATTSHTSITLEEETTVRFRLSYYANVALNNTITPMAFSGNWAYEFIPPVSTADYELRARGLKNNSDINITDLNNMTQNGFYAFWSTNTYTNLPTGVTGAGAFLVVYGDKGDYVRQLLYKFSSNSISTFDVYMRVRNTSTNWNAWKKVYSMNDVDVPILADGTDLDDITKSGTGRIIYSYDYDNAPISGANGLLFSYKTEGGAYTVQVAFYYDQTKAIYVRFLSGNPLTWKPWSKIYDLGELNQALGAVKTNATVKYTDSTSTATTANEGTKLRVMSYNVAKYNKDTSTYMPEEKRFNFKKMLSLIQPDIIGIQEGIEFIDNVSKDAMEYLYKPVLPFNRGTGATQQVSKKPFVDGGLVRMTDDWLVNNVFRWSTLRVKHGTLLFCCVHPIARHNGSQQTPWEPVDSEASIADRKIEYTKIMKWVNHEIDLAYYQNGDYDAMVRRFAPAWDYCVICGDMNSITDDDKDNLTDIVDEYGFTMANGGALGWMWTERDVSGADLYALDNIIVSPNIIINGVTAYQGMYENLYSDHVPVVADLTLLASDTVTVSGTTPTITAMPDTRYICGEITSLSFTPSATGICNVRFTSGSTPTALTLPYTVKMPEWWVGTEANKTYEISIADGVYGAVMSWD